MERETREVSTATSFSPNQKSMLQDGYQEAVSLRWHTYRVQCGEYEANFNQRLVMWQLGRVGVVEASRQRDADNFMDIML